MPRILVATTFRNHFNRTQRRPANRALNYTESNSNPIFALGMVFLTVVTVVLGCIAYQRHLADVAVDLANRQVVNEYLLPDAGRPRNRWNEPASPDTKDRVENTPEERPEKDHAEKPIASTRKSASAGSTTIPSIAVPNLSAATEFGAIPFGGLPDFNGSTTIPTSDPTLQNQFQDLGKLSPEEFERHLTQFVEDSQDFGPESMHNSLEELIGTGIGVNQSNEQGFRPPYRPFNQPRTSTPAGPSYAYEGVGLSPTNSGIPPTNYRAPGHTSASSPLPGTNLPTPSVSKPWSARSTRPGEHGLSDSTGVVPIVKRSHNRMTGYPSIGSSGNLPNLAYPSMPPAPRAPAGPMAPGMNPGVNSGIRHGAGISTSIGPLVGPQNNLSTALPPLPGNGGPTKPPTQYGSGYGGSPNPGGPLTMARPVPPTGNGASSSQWPSVPSTNASRFSPGF